MDALKSLREEFMSILRRADAEDLALFMVWLDVTLAEYKIHGFLRIDSSICQTESPWMKQLLNNYSETNNQGKSANSSLDTSSSGGVGGGGGGYRMRTSTPLYNKPLPTKHAVGLSDESFQDDFIQSKYEKGCAIIIEDEDQETIMETPNQIVRPSTHKQCRKSSNPRSITPGWRITTHLYTQPQTTGTSTKQTLANPSSRVPSSYGEHPISSNQHSPKLSDSGVQDMDAPPSVTSQQNGSALNLSIPHATSLSQQGSLLSHDEAARLQIQNVFSITPPTTGIQIASQSPGGAGELSTTSSLPGHQMALSSGRSHLLQLFSCTFCPRKFTTRSAMMRHHNEQHMGKKMQCNLCKRKFSRQHELISHISLSHHIRELEAAKYVQEVKNSAIPIDQPQLSLSPTPPPPSSNPSAAGPDPGKGGSQSAILVVPVVEKTTLATMLSQPPAVLTSLLKSNELPEMPQIQPQKPPAELPQPCNMVESEGMDEKMDTKSADMKIPKVPEKLLKSLMMGKGKKFCMCNKCGKTFTTTSAFRRHRREVHVNRKRFHCIFCPKRFNRRNRMKEHIKQKHQQEDSNDFVEMSNTDGPERPTDPSLSNDNALSNSAVSSDHSDVSSGDDSDEENSKEEMDIDMQDEGIVWQEGQEEQIQQQQQPPEQLQEQQQNQQEQQQQQQFDNRENGTAAFVVCDICDKTFTSQSTLNRHRVEQHTNQRVQCLLCGKIFTRKDYLRKHQVKFHGLPDMENYGTGQASPRPPGVSGDSPANPPEYVDVFELAGRDPINKLLDENQQNPSAAAATTQNQEIIIEEENSSQQSASNGDGEDSQPSLVAGSEGDFGSVQELEKSGSSAGLNPETVDPSEGGVANAWVDPESSELMPPGQPSTSQGQNDTGTLGSVKEEEGPLDMVVDQDDGSLSPANFSVGAAGKAKQSPGRVKGKTDFFCGVCHKYFSCRSSLLRHSYKHTGEKIFQCDLCYKQFYRRDKYNEHLAHHKQLGWQ